MLEVSIGITIIFICKQHDKELPIIHTMSNKSELLPY
jgi:hypothetical protein